MKFWEMSKRSLTRSRKVQLRYSLLFIPDPFCFRTDINIFTEQMELSALAAKLADGPDGSHKLGAFLNGQISKLVNTKMPGGFPLSSLKAYISTKFGLGEGRTEAVLLHGVLAEPKQRLGSEDEAKRWLDTIVGEYARAKGITVADSTQASGSDGGSAGKMIDSAVLDKLEERGKLLVRDQMKAFYKYLNENPLEVMGKVKLLEELLQEKEEELSVWLKEHGEEYGKGIKPIFDPKKERRYDSAWNWTRLDALVLFYDYACGRERRWNNDIRERLYRLKNRATPNVVEMTNWAKKKANDDGHPEIINFINILMEILRTEMNILPVYRELAIPMAPHMEVDDKGHIDYKEIPRTGVKDMLDYVNEMGSGSKKQKVQDNDITDANQLQLVLQQLSEQKVDPSLLQNLKQIITKTINEEKEKEQDKPLPYIFLRRKGEDDPSSRVYAPEQTKKYLAVLRDMAAKGISFSGKTILITGCGKDSIGNTSCNEISKMNS